MARTKQHTRQSVGAKTLTFQRNQATGQPMVQCQKQPKTKQPQPPFGVKKPYRFKPGTIALR